MTTKIEQAARQVLVFIESLTGLHVEVKEEQDETITALREPLAEQAEQEPIGMVMGGELVGLVEEYKTGAWPIYAAPVEPVKQEPVACWRSVLEGLRNEDDCDAPAGSERKAGWHAALDEFKEAMLLAELDAAPVRTKDLTDDEIDALIYKAWPELLTVKQFAHSVIAAYREKNK